LVFTGGKQFEGWRVLMGYDFSVFDNIDFDKESAKDWCRERWSEPSKQWQQCVTVETANIKHERAQKEQQDMLFGTAVIFFILAFILTAIFLYRRHFKKHRQKYKYLEQYASWRTIKVLYVVSLTGGFLVTFFADNFPSMPLLFLAIVALLFYPCFLMIRWLYIYISGHSIK